MFFGHMFPNPIFDENVQSWIEEIEVLTKTNW